MPAVFRMDQDWLPPLFCRQPSAAQLFMAGGDWRQKCRELHRERAESAYRYFSKLKIGKHDSANAFSNKFQQSVSAKPYSNQLAANVFSSPCQHSILANKTSDDRRFSRTLHEFVHFERFGADSIAKIESVGIQWFQLSVNYKSDLAKFDEAGRGGL